VTQDKKRQADAHVVTDAMRLAGAHELSILGLCDHAGEGAAEEVFRAMIAASPYSLTVKSTAES
jgi:hypothetical protein